MSTLRRSMTGAVAAMVALGLLGACSEDGDPVDPQPDPGSVQATVTGDGSALAGVTVRLFADGGTTAIASGTSNAAGQVTFATVAPGAYDVEVVVLAGYELATGQTARRDVTVTSNATATVTFGLEEIVVAPTVGQVRVRVADSGAGIEDVEVELFASGGGAALASGQTAADGRVLFGTLDPGSYEVEITLPADHEIAPGDTTRMAVTVTAGVTTDVEFEVEAPAATVVEIEVDGISFSPNDVTISPGMTVRWVWVGGGSHTVTPDGHSQWTSTPLTGAGQTLEVVFDNTGDFPYFCIPHQSLGMTGIVRVQ